MRVTPNMSSQNALYNIQKNRAVLDKIQEQLASQQTINRPSDDPINTRYLLDMNDKFQAGTQYLSNLNKADTWLSFSETALTGMQEIMKQANSVVSAISGGSQDATELKNVASQLTELKKQLVDMGNTQYGDQYIFAGTDTNVPPFSVTGPPYDSATSNEATMDVEVRQNSNLTMNVLGKQILTADTAATQPYGNKNILSAMDSLITQLNSANPDFSVIRQNASDLEDGTEQITNAQSDVASKRKRVQTMVDLNTYNNNTLATLRDATLLADTYKLAIQQTSQQTALEATLSSTAKISQMSLLDYI